MRYGMPYQGSKNQIAEQIIANLPKAEHFYDVFGGGGAMTHCAILSGKYKYVHYNELNPLICNGFRMAINGDFRNNTQWVSREDFNNLKQIDPFVAMCWSFGNNLNMYMYAKEIEPWKKALHWLYINQNDSLMRSFGLNPPVFYSRTETRAWIKANKQEIKQKYISWYKKTFFNDETAMEIEFAKKDFEEVKEQCRMYLRNALKESGLTQSDCDRRLNSQMSGHYFGKSQWEFPTREVYAKLQEFLPLPLSFDEAGGRYFDRLQSLQSLESLESLQRLQSLERLQRLESRILITNNSYEDLSFEQNSVIYCDPPYKNTKGYNNTEFDFDKFESWVESQKQTVFISEQNEYPKWNLIWGKETQNKYANGNKSRRLERLYVV